MTWEAAIDAYLDGELAKAARVMRLAPSDLARQATAAREAWTAQARTAASAPAGSAEWRLATRRVQASAAFTLDILSSLSTQVRLLDAMKAYETTATDAWKQLDDWPVPGSTREAAIADRLRLRQFRTWWYIGYLQFLSNAGRHRDFIKQAQQIRLADADRAQRAEFYLLQGIVEESLARMIHGEALYREKEPTEATRLDIISHRFDAAAGWYRRGLKEVPGHVEASLHLGRVLLDLERPEAALKALEPLLSSGCDSTACALASLFAGEAHEMAGANDKAAEAYQRAARARDVRQAATLAGMQLAVRNGDGTGLSWLEQLGGEPAGSDGVDAWSVYLRGRRQNVDAVLGPLREAILP